MLYLDPDFHFVPGMQQFVVVLDFSVSCILVSKYDTYTVQMRFQRNNPSAEFSPKQEKLLLSSKFLFINQVGRSQEIPPKKTAKIE